MTCSKVSVTDHVKKVWESMKGRGNSEVPERLSMQGIMNVFSKIPGRNHADETRESWKIS
jgi:hypothetical protein